MSSFTVDVGWDGTGWWIVTVPGVPGAVTQVERLVEIQAGLVPEHITVRQR